MNASRSKPQIDPTANAFAWLYPLFFLSGISGLMYEVVWVRMLTRVLGSTVYATSTVLAAFMAGLAMGSFLIGRFIDQTRHPLRWYALLELGIGLAALWTMTLPDRMLPLYHAIYDFAGGSRAWLTAGQVSIALLVLLPPTALMGATLPTLCAEGVRRHQDFGRCVGVLYSVNTLGAVAGVLASGFVLIGEFGETVTVITGVALNAAVAVAAWLLSRGRPAHAPAGFEPGLQLRESSLSSLAEPNLAQPSPVSSYPASCRRIILLVFMLSGLVALANEVVWGRMLLLYQDTSIYAFSSMLAVVLGSMGLGSLLGGRFVVRWSDPLRQLARVQLAIGLAGALALHLFPYVPKGFFWPAVVLLGPLGLLWGLAFPVGTVCYSQSQAVAGRSIAELYGWNTLGCIIGSLSAGFVLLPWLGSSRTVASLAAVSLLLGLLLLGADPLGLTRRLRGTELLLGGLALALLATAGDPYHLALERSMRKVYPELEVMRHVEDATAATTAFRLKGGLVGDKQLWINGVGMTCLAPVTKLMSHLPIALVDEPRDVLVICFGMGTTVRSASRHPGLQIHAVELVPAVIEDFGLFHEDGPEILKQANVHPLIDDGRNYLLMNAQEYDVITIDPAPPLYSAGTVNLYSREFFTLCRQRLRPGGLVCLWVPPDRLSEVKMIISTYLAVFPHVRAWSGPEPHPGFLLLGSHQPLAMASVPRKIHRLFENKSVADDLGEWQTSLNQPEKILDLYVGDEQVLRDIADDAPIITDDCPYTEFYLWRSRGRSRKDREYGIFIRALPYKKRQGQLSTRNPFQ